jgi:predicted AlkP superfamily pyrophosphatase or phosphodiesterase
MKKALLFSLLYLFFLPYTKSQNKPKLVVGIVVDQMRYDYLYRFEKHYTNGGFKRLLSEGFEFTNAQYNYVPTYTAPGHTSIYTGTTPSIHGIIGNNWFDKKSNKSVYCTDDETVKNVGGLGNEGKMSPRKMLTTTFGDELKLSNNRKSKVIGIALKDRGAILPAGHLGNAAYWFEGKSGNWISSTFYFDTIPVWVQKFNGKKFPEMYLTQKWQTLLPVETYIESIDDNNNYEKSFDKNGETSFPHDIPALYAKNKNFDLLKEIPFGNTFTKDFAIEAIESENLGKGEFTDVITISFSSTDYVGHRFGVSSKEIEDTYVRLDRDIEELLKYLDVRIGKGEYTVFLTADHGAADNANYLKYLDIPAGTINDNKLGDTLKLFIKKNFGDSIFLNFSNQQVFINEKLFSERKLSMQEFEQKVIAFLMNIDGIQNCNTASDMNKNSFSDIPRQMMQNGFNSKKSGAVLVNYQPGWVEYGAKGSTHGAPFSYDTRVPLLFFGKGINKGRCYEKVNITDIAPSISTLLNAPFPNGCSGKPLNVYFTK